MDDEPKVLISNRVADQPIVYVPGSKRIKCSECQEEVWLSPSSQSLIKQEGVSVICTRCMAERLEKMSPEEREERKVQMPSEDQMKEIFAWMFNRERN